MDHAFLSDNWLPTMLHVFCGAVYIPHVQTQRIKCVICNFSLLLLLLFCSEKVKIFILYIIMKWWSETVLASSVAVSNCDLIWPSFKFLQVIRRNETKETRKVRHTGSVVHVQQTHFFWRITRRNRIIFINTSNHSILHICGYTEYDYVSVQVSHSGWGLYLSRERFTLMEVFGICLHC